MIVERAYAKANLVLQIGPPREDRLHPICSLFASLELADELAVEEHESDVLECRGVEGDNLAARALDAIREAAPGTIPLLRIRIDKRVPVAAGLGGGSADAAAVLRGANEIAGRPLGTDALRAIAARVGSDVPSQIEPRHALVCGVGEEVEPVSIPPAAVLLVPATEGLRTAEAYAELDRLEAWRERLDPERVREAVAAPLPRLAEAVENDLQRAVLSLRPELESKLAELREAGALASAVTGSGPTAFGLFATEEEAHRAAAALPGAIVTRTRRIPAAA